MAARQELTDKLVRSLTVPSGKTSISITDSDGGLTIYVSASGAKVWRYRYRSAGEDRPLHRECGRFAWPLVHISLSPAPTAAGSRRGL